MRRSDSIRVPDVEIQTSIDTRPRMCVTTIATPCDHDRLWAASLDAIRAAESELSAYLDAHEEAPNPQETDR